MWVNHIVSLATKFINQYFNNLYLFIDTLQYEIVAYMQNMNIIKMLFHSATRGCVYGKRLGFRPSDAHSQLPFGIFELISNLQTRSCLHVMIFRTIVFLSMRTSPSGFSFARGSHSLFFIYRNNKIFQTFAVNNTNHY